MRIGRARGTVGIELLNDSDELVYSEAIPFDESRFKLSGSGERFVVTIESGTALRDLIDGQSKKDDETVVVALNAIAISGTGFLLKKYRRDHDQHSRCDPLNSLKQAQVDSIIA